MRKQNILILLCFIVSFNLFRAQTNPPDTVLVGAYVASLHDFDIANNSINADIHLWCLYDNEDYNFKSELECLYCNEFNLTGTSVDTVNEQNWEL